MSVAAVESKLRGLAPVHLEVIDESGGCGAKLRVLIVSSQFDGLSLLDRHRLVNTTLKEELPLLHALSISAKTPAQWAATAAPQ